MFGQLLRKEFILIANTPMLFVMNTLYPIIIIGILPFATTMDIKSLNTIIIDQDRSSTSSELQQKFFQTGYFLPVDNAESILTFNQAYDLIEAGKADVVITFPKDFERNIINGNGSDLQLVVNSINATKGAMASAYSQQIVMLYQQQILAKFNPNSSSFGVSFHQKTLFNPNKNYKQFIVPGMITILVTLLAITMPAIGIVQEKEYGTIEQLNVTPVKPYQVLLSKALPYWIIIAGIMPILIVMGGLLYGLWPKGSFLGIEITSLLNAISFTGIGLIIANYSSRLQQLMFMIIFVLINVLLLGGIFTPVTGMPLWAQIIAKGLPIYYYVIDMRALFLRGSGLADIWQDVLILAGVALLLSVIALVTYRKRD